VTNRCLFCGGDATEPDHLLRCDGRQGRIEAPDDDARYPHRAGWKATDTSYEAAATTDAATIRDLVVRWLRAHGPHTADETADALGLGCLTVRPRFSELRALDQLVDTGERHVNVSGKRAIVWALIDARRGIA
jgi:hypothetical protein